MDVVAELVRRARVSAQRRGVDVHAVGAVSSLTTLMRLLEASIGRPAIASAREPPCGRRSHWHPFRAIGVPQELPFAREDYRSWGRPVMVDLTAVYSADFSPTGERSEHTKLQKRDRFEALSGDSPITAEGARCEQLRGAQDHPEPGRRPLPRGPEHHRQVRRLDTLTPARCRCR